MLDCARWRPNSPLPKKEPKPPIFGPCLLWPNGWINHDATWYGSRPQPRPHCVRREPTRQTIEYGTHIGHMVFTWRTWAAISHIGRMWDLDGVLLPIWEQYGSGMGGSTWQRSCGTQMGPMWAEKFDTFVKRPYTGLIWALGGQRYVTMPMWDTHGCNVG